MIDLHSIAPTVPKSSVVPTPSTSSLASATPTSSTLSLMSATPTLSLEPSTLSNHTNGACQLGAVQLVAACDTPDSARNELDPSHGTSIMEFINSYQITKPHLTNESQPTNKPQQMNEPQLSTLVHTHLQENTGSLDLSLEIGMTQNTDPTPPPNPLADITNEPVWMRKK